MNKLYLKHHGLPGISQSKGLDGANGNNGNNVYVGYINEFFNSIDYITDSLENVETVKVVNTLNNNIKAGDVIYFHTTDSSIFKKEPNIEYMVVITKSLENCYPETLISAATIVDPLSFKHLDTTVVKNTNYLSTHNRISSVYYNDDSNIISSHCGKNFCNLLNYGSDSAMNLGHIYHDTDSSINTLLLQAEDDKEKVKSSLVFKTNIDNSTPYNIITSETDSSIKSSIKISNAYVKTYNIGNVETMRCVIPDYIILDSDFHCYTITENDYDYTTNTITINSNNIISNDSFDDYECGVIDIVYNHTKNKDTDNICFIEGLNCIIHKYVFTSHNNMSFTLSKDYRFNTSHDVLFWISTTNGIKYYSNHTIMYYDYKTKKYSFSYKGNTASIEDSSIDNIIYTPAGITTDLFENGTLKIELPNLYQAKDVSIYVNSRDLTKEDSYLNSWCSLTYDSGNIDTSTIITLNIDASDNIPLFNFLTTREYVASPGTISSNDEKIGSELFRNILSDAEIFTKDRDITITVKTRSSNDDSIKSYYKLSQPGYVEKRKIPKIDLSIESDLHSLENANNIDNGVLNNQFQFILDVNISDFDRECWSSYVDEDNITLNFDIKNVPYDYETIEKYNMLSPDTSMYSYHAYTKDPSIDFGEIINDKNTNYVKINVYPIDSDIVNPYNVTLKELYPLNYVYDSSNSTSNKTINYYGDNITIIQEYSTDVSVNTITINSNLFKDIDAEEDSKSNPEETAKTNTGINDAVTIQIRNLKFSDVKNNKLRFRVFVEVANPVFSKLFFRYYVSNMWIHYVDKTLAETVDISNPSGARPSQAKAYNIWNTGSITTYQDEHNNDETKYESYFYVGTDNLVKERDYMYASNTFNAFICPLSLTAIENDSTLKTVKYSSGKLSGSDEQIKLTIDTYIPEISSKTDSQKVEAINQHQINWFDFNLKKKYLQDNIKSIYVQPIHISDFYDKLSDDDLFIQKNSNRNVAYNSIKTEINSDSYLSVVYNAYAYYQKITYDEMLFYYNDELYKSSQYNQLQNNSPVFVSQSIGYDIRNSVLMSSMDVWNHLYKTVGSGNDNGLFTGHINSYGNGYQFVDSKYDLIQSTDNELSLADTIAQNEYSFFDSPYSQIISLTSKESINYPNSNKWFRTLLWQLKWQYAKYHTDSSSLIKKVDTYDIVDSGTYNAEYNAVTNKYMIPHNLTYSIYPRCAYNSDNDINIIFMLRCPSICKENQYKIIKDSSLGINNVKFSIDEDSYNDNQLSNNDLTSLL